MYTSTNTSSPVRTTSTFETTSSNYQTQSYHSANYLNTMNDNYQPTRRLGGSGGFSNSASSLNAPASSRGYSTNYNYSPTNRHRYQSTSYRPSANDYQGYSPPSNSRAYSYDDLLNEQNRSSMYPSRTTSSNPYGQGQYTRRDPSSDYDDELIVKSTDLPASYEQEMIDLVRAAFQKYQISNQRELAGFLKRSADKRFAPCWHCIVGRQFSSYVTHEMNGFIYFTKGPLSILLFKSGA